MSNDIGINVEKLEITDASIEFNGLSIGMSNVDKKDEKNITVAMENYKIFCDSLIEKERNRLYEKIDQTLFELEDNQMLVYVPKDMKVIGVKSAFVTKLFKKESNFNKKNTYIKAQILEINCEFTDNTGSVKTEWVLLTNYSPTQFVKKTISEEII